MAVTSIWPIKGSVAAVIEYARNPEKTREESSVELHKINNVIQYAANELKTEYHTYVNVINLAGAETAAEEFMETKRLKDKTGGRQCFHGYQSFRPGEVDAKTAHEIGMELADRLWGDYYQVVVATHCNTGCYHNHFVLNSVSFKDGRHYHNSRADYRYMREMSDWVCRKHGLSVIENPTAHGKHYCEIVGERKGHLSIRATIRLDIDQAVRRSVTFEEFCAHMKNKGYEFKLYTIDGEPLVYPALKPPGAKGFFRFHKLGDGYELYQIKKRVHNNVARAEPFPEAERCRVHQYRQEHPVNLKNLSGLHRLYVRYCYELHIIERFPASVSRLPFTARKDLLFLEKLDEETRILGANRITTLEELRAHKQELQNRVAQLTEERAALRREALTARRRSNPASEDEAKVQIADRSKLLRCLRRELALCDDIESRSIQSAEEMELFIREQQSEAREVNEQWHTQTMQRNRS